MTNLKLVSEQDGKSWNLNPSREYFVGSSSDCEIILHDSGVDSKHLKFSFDLTRNMWYVHDLSANGSFINDQRIVDYPIVAQTRILVTNLVYIIATQEANNETMIQPPVSNWKISNWKTPAPIEKLINRGFFDREDPQELRGYFLTDFSISTNKTIDLENHPQFIQIRQDLYEEIYQTLKDFKKNDQYLEDKLHFRIVKYIDNKYQTDDRDRLYIEIVLDTIRNTKITTLCRFFIHGNNLYIAADSYALGRLKKRNLILHVIILFILLTSLPLLLISIIPGALALLYLYYTWIKFIKTLFQGESVAYALRINFQKKISSNFFDLDDSYMFLKSLLPLIIESLKKVLKKHGLLDESLKESLEQISKNIGNQTININASGGIFGSVIGSTNSKINN